MKHRTKGRSSKRGRKIPMTPEVTAAIQRQLEAFREKFGRDPEPHEPVFFDPSKDVPTEIDESVIMGVTIKAMIEAQIRPMLIYTYVKTGRLVTSDNWQYLTDADRREWNEACDEWNVMTPHEQLDWLMTVNP